MLLTVGMRAERLAPTHQYITDEQRAEPDKHLNAHLNNQFLKLFRSVVALIMQGRFVFYGLHTSDSHSPMGHYYYDTTLQNTHENESLRYTS